MKSFTSFLFSSLCLAAAFKTEMARAESTCENETHDDLKNLVLQTFAKKSCSNSWNNKEKTIYNHACTGTLDGFYVKVVYRSLYQDKTESPYNFVVELKDPDDLTTLYKEKLDFITGKYYNDEGEHIPNACQNEMIYWQDIINSPNLEELGGCQGETHDYLSNLVEQTFGSEQCSGSWNNKEQTIRNDLSENTSEKHTSLKLSALARR